MQHMPLACTEPVRGSLRAEADFDANKSPAHECSKASSRQVDVVLTVCRVWALIELPHATDDVEGGTLSATLLGEVAAIMHANSTARRAREFDRTTRPCPGQQLTVNQARRRRRWCMPHSKREPDVLTFGSGERTGRGVRGARP